MRVLRAEAQPEPGFDVIVERGHQRVLARTAFVDPPLRRERVEIADDLGFEDGVAGRLDPDVRPQIRSSFRVPMRNPATCPSRSATAPEACSSFHDDATSERACAESWNRSGSNDSAPQ